MQSMLGRPGIVRGRPDHSTAPGPFPPVPQGGGNPNTGEVFIEKREQARRDGNLAFVARNLPRRRVHPVRVYLGPFGSV